jgi:outer membrane immunogenic protein
MRTVLTAFLILTALEGHARAGGMLVEYADAAPTPTSWTGCYGGGHLGGVWGTSDKWIPRTPGGAFEGVSLGGHDVDGFIGGAQVGCDYQLANGIVLGIGGNYGWTDADGTHPSARETGVFYHSETEGLGALTGRLGYAFGEVLLYVEGGAAWERVSYAASTTQIGTAYRATDTRHGWTIGGGGEYAITKHLSAFVEYAHYDFGTERVTLDPQYSFLPTAYVDIDDTANVVRAGVNLRFGR